MSITFQRFGNLGRLGNHVMQLMSLYGIADKYKMDLLLPAWRYSQFFKHPPKVSGLPPVKPIQEPHFHYSWDWLDTLDFNKIVNINGFLQSPKYYEHCRKTVIDLMAFDEVFETNLLNKYEKWFKKKTIAISVRRGDFVNNATYFQLTVNYYITALFEHFPDWQDRNLIFFSDDIPYCKIHFDCLENAFFAENLSDIEQLCLMTHCEHYIISNSTFSYCGAILSKNTFSDAKVIRPLFLFGDEFRKNNSEKDYWPESWIICEAKKIDLKDTTFTVPVHYDHPDRKQNLDLSVCMLQRDFDTNIIIGEQGSSQFGYMGQWAKYHAFELPQFHRTKMLNDMAMMAETPIIVNWDADVFIPALQIWMAAERIRKGEDMVYPYDGKFARVPRGWFPKLEKSLDIGIFQSTQFKGKHGKPIPISSVGGAVMFDKESFIEGGMENEHMISYAPEDCERYDRFKVLDYKVSRVNGSLYHLDHFCGPNSTSRNPLFKKNHDELDKIRAMKADQLRKYIESWPWVHMYGEKYYKRIQESAVISAQHVYEILNKNGIKLGNVIDIGCGIGEWGYQQISPCSYTGVDFKIPKKSLLIPPENYIEYDLTSGKEFPLKKKFHTVLCLEVIEHIPQEHAINLVKLLCSLGDRVLFSAAIPYQGGVGHVNEQWQNVWDEHFYFFQFGPSDFQPREAMFYDDEIDVWYRQNIVLYEKGTTINKTKPFIHPKMWENHMSTRE